MSQKLRELPTQQRSLTFEGESHRLFIEGRGFDFEKLVVGLEGKAKLFLKNSKTQITMSRI